MQHYGVLDLQLPWNYIGNKDYEIVVAGENNGNGVPIVMFMCAFIVCIRIERHKYYFTV